MVRELLLRDWLMVKEKLSRGCLLMVELLLVGGIKEC